LPQPPQFLRDGSPRRPHIPSKVPPRYLQNALDILLPFVCRFLLLLYILLFPSVGRHFSFINRKFSSFLLFPLPRRLTKATTAPLVSIHIPFVVDHLLPFRQSQVCSYHRWRNSSPAQPTTNSTIPPFIDAPGTSLATSISFTASVKPSAPLYFSLIGQPARHLKRSSSLHPIVLFPSFLVSRTPSVENGNQRFSLLYVACQSLFYFLLRWSPFFFLLRPFNFFSFSPEARLAVDNTG